MKKTQLLTTLLLVALMATSCNGDKPSTSNTPNPSTSDTQTSTTPTPSVEHQDPLVKDIDEGALIRKYNDAFDTMVEDFSGTTLVGKTEKGVFSSHGVLRVLVDSKNGDFPCSTDASIYKMATGNYAIQDYDTIGFVIRKVNGTIDYSNLVLALRGDDAWNVHEINLAKAVDNDGTELVDLNDEFQMIKISPNLSIEDADTEYTLASNSEKSGTKVLDKILGFHLYAKGECSSLLEIKEVFLEKAEQKTILDSFDRVNVNKADATCWWRDSTGFIVTPGITLKDGASYTTPDFTLNDNTNLVLNLLGDTTKTTITPISTNANNKSVSWADLKDENGELVKNAVNGSFNSLAINLKNSGLEVEGLKGFKISSTNEITISSVFLSSLKEKEAAKEYPHLDTENAVIFDDFSRKQSGFDGDYDKSANSDVIKNAGLYYALSYNNGDKISIDGDVATFEAMPDNYIQLKEGSSRARTTQKYMVFVMKLEGEGDLSGFRFSNGSGEAHFASTWKAGEGLPSIPEDMNNYPYKTNDGFAYYIIDLEASGITDVKDCIDMYYTGTATLKIDSIFFADEYEILDEVSGYIENKEAVTLEQYHYAGNVAITKNTRYVAMTIEGDGENATLKSFRLGFAGNEYWAKDAKWISKGGVVVDSDHVIAETGETFILDLALCGLEIVPETLHLHMGGFDNATGSVLITKIVALNTGVKMQSFFSDGATVDYKDGSYKYQYGGYFPGNSRQIAIHLSGSDDATLKSLRIRFEGTTYDKTLWAKDGLTGLQLKNTDGSDYDYSQKITSEIIVFINLDLINFPLNEACHIHLNFGDFDGEKGVINIISLDSVLTTLPYDEVMNNYGEH